MQNAAIFTYLCPPPPLHRILPCIEIGGGGARESSLASLQIYTKHLILAFSGAFARWPRWYYWRIAMHFRFLVAKALHFTFYHVEHFSFSF